MDHNHQLIEKYLEKDYFVISDLDGTLLQSGSDFTPSSLKVENLMNLDLLKADESGKVNGIICTGRPFDQLEAIRKLFDRIKIEFKGIVPRSWPRPTSMTSQAFYTRYWSEKLQLFSAHSEFHGGKIWVLEDDTILLHCLNALEIPHLAFTNCVCVGGYAAL